jgi:hypothetical protein
MHNPIPFLKGSFGLLLVIGAFSVHSASAEIQVARDFPIEVSTGQDTASALVKSYRRDVQDKPVSKSAEKQAVVAKSGN